MSMVQNYPLLGNPLGPNINTPAHQHIMGDAHSVQHYKTLECHATVGDNSDTARLWSVRQSNVAKPQ